MNDALSQLFQTPPEPVADQWGVQRTQALARFEELGLPHKKAEQWRFTSLRSLTEASFELGVDELTSKQLEIAQGLVAAQVPVCNACSCLVLVDGIVAPSLSDYSDYPGALHFLHGNQPVPPAVAADFGTADGVAGTAFGQLNTAVFKTGIAIVLDQAVRAENHFLLVHVHTGIVGSLSENTRLLVVGGANSEANIVEQFIGSDGRYWRNPVSEIHLKDGCHLSYTRVQQEGSSAVHTGIVAAKVASNARFECHSFALGGRLSRVDISAKLDGRNAGVTMNGLMLGDGERIVDHHTRIDHAEPDCQSDQVFKTILDGKSRGIFNGRIKVHEDAQRTAADQSSRNLLLTDSAIIDTNPELEIYADDVRCTHGATIGFLDEEALFYLRSRGIPGDEARNLMVYAFASEVVDAIGWEPMRKLLLGEIYDHLPRGTIIERPFSGPEVE